LSNLLSPIVLVELACLAGVLLLAWLAPGGAARRLGGIEGALGRLPTSLVGQLAFIALFAFLLRAAFLPWVGPPVPLIPDEYSLLLQAQTYLELRMANPTPEHWPHFQAMHVNQVPAYASMYFPGRGFPLALGLLLGGEPFIGVWLSFVLFAMSAVWMLRGWTTPRIALAGGILVVIRLGAASYWVNSYWGGAFTGLGAMLVFGALPRLMRRPSWSCGLVLGIGALIMMTTRPFEGAVFCAAAGLFFLPRLLKAGWRNLGPLAQRAGLPLAVSLAVGLGTLGAYNVATTGDALTTPYDINRAQYATTPAFLFQPRITPEPPAALPGYFGPVYANEEISHAASRQSFTELVKFELIKLFNLFVFYVGFAMAIPLLIGLWRSRLDLPVVGSAIVMGAGHLLTSWHFPHYAAPIFAPLLLMTMRGVSTLGRWSPRGRAVGYVVSRGAFVTAASPLLVLVAHLATGAMPQIVNSWNRPCCAVRQTSEHAQIREQLRGLPGKDLVLVAYNEHFLTFGDVVYNEPDIGRSEVVFAHSLDARSDARLLAGFADRRQWRLEFTRGGYALVPLRR
jgi:hypothetical protein